MPSHEGIEVWIEDSEHRRLNDDPTINLVDADDRTVYVKTEMLRDELYTVHCRSPMSVVCDVFVITAAGFRRSAARFYLDKSLATPEYATGSSTDHTLEQFKHGLRTPKRIFQRDSTTNKLGTVEIEVRRIGEIIKDEPRKEYPDDKSDDGVEFIMIDKPDQPPWVIFRFDIDVKVTMPAKFKRRPRLMPRDRSLTVSAGNETSCEISHDGLHNPKKRCREHDSYEEYSSPGAGGDPSPRDTDLELLQQEYEKEEAEEERLLQKLQERLHAKRMRNIELRRLLGETNET